MSNENENEMKEKLEQAGQKAEDMKAERQARVVKGSHLLAAMNEAIANSGLNTEKKTAYVKVLGASKGKSLYVALKGGRVDLSGFDLELAAVKRLTEAEAKQKHLGKVRGQLDFTASDEEVMSAFNRALETLKVPAPATDEVPAPNETPPGLA